MKGLIIFAYFLFLIIFSLFTYLFIDPGFSYLRNIFTSFAFIERTPTVIFYISSIVIFFAFYIYFLKWVHGKHVPLRNLWIFIGISGLILTFSYPAVLSYDLFNYMATAKVLYFYGENPYFAMPIEFINDPMLSYTRAANKYALYGPSWLVLSSVPYYLSIQNVIMQMFLFKALVGVFYFLTVYVMYKLSKSILIISLFALNPLVLIEVFISGHNDIVMIFFSLFSFYLLQKRRFLWAIIFIILSIFIKYATLFLIPVFMYVLWRNIQGENVQEHRIWKYSSVLMLIIFMLSPFREELYPWYFIWIFPFVLLYNKKLVTAIAASFSFGLLFYYVPYMYTGHYLLVAKYLFVLIPTVILFVVFRMKFFKDV